MGFARSDAVASADLTALKAQASRRDPAADVKVAREFERLFGEMMVGAMRQASFGDSLFPNESGLYRDLYDKEIVKQMSAGNGLGIADMMLTQLRAKRAATEAPGEDAAPLAFPVPARNQQLRGYVMPDDARGPSNTTTGTSGIAGKADVATSSPTSCGAPAAAQSSSSMPDALATARARLAIAPRITTKPGEALPAPMRETASMGGTLDEAKQAFITRIMPHAQRAAQHLGVPLEIVVAQAALETGWGRSLLSQKDNNLFGVKATGSWQGARATYATQEFAQGQARTENAQFRGYDSVAHSFDDYVSLLSKPRYANARASGNDPAGFAHALQSAGYATDPQYANKLLAIARSGSMRDALAAAGTAADDTTAAATGVLIART